MQRTFLALSLALLLTACKTGYRNEGGTWVWVSYDESVGKRITLIDPHDDATFQVLRPEEYARDAQSVFYMGRTLRGADPNTFKVIGKEGFSQDANKVFFNNERVALADPKSFQVLTFPYSRDVAHVFCGTLPMDIGPKESQEFKVTNTDKLMANMRSSMMLKYFIEFNPEYQWLDTLGIEGVITGEWGTGETKNRKFKGYKEMRQ